MLSNIIFQKGNTKKPQCVCSWESCNFFGKLQVENKAGSGIMAELTSKVMENPIFFNDINPLIWINNFTTDCHFVLLIETNCVLTVFIPFDQCSHCTQYNFSWFFQVALPVRRNLQKTFLIKNFTEFLHNIYPAVK